MSWACRSDDLFLIHRFPRNLGQDLKRAEGTRHGSVINELAELVYELLAISDTIMFFALFLDSMRQRTPRNQCMLLLDMLKRLLFAKCSWNYLPKHSKKTQRPLRPGKKSQLNLTFHLEWCCTNPIRNGFFHINKTSHTLMMVKKRIQPIHPWTDNEAATWTGFSAFHLTLKNCLQQTEASSRNDAKENDLAPFVHSKPCTNLFLLISFTLSTHTRMTSDPISPASRSSCHMSPQFYPFSLSRPVSKPSKLGNAKHFRTFAQPCVPSKRIIELPWTIAMSWACRSDDSIKRSLFDPQIP